jgi:hypothetical protein
VTVGRHSKTNGGVANIFSIADQGRLLGQIAAKRHGAVNRPSVTGLS